MEMRWIYHRIYFKNFRKSFDEKIVKSQGQSVYFDQTLTFCKIKEKESKMLRKLYIQKLEKKIENFHI